jgi:nicotinamide-nucleotide amidase
MASIELLTVGTELLLGFTVDTNSAEIGRTLAAAGVSVARRTTVGDNAAAIRDAVSAALDRSGIVLVTGGLGPTADDVTKKAVAELFQAPLEFQQAVWDALVARFARMGRVPSPANRSQAEVPRGATVLPNRWGTAPGLWLEGSPGVVIMLPGVPHEMRNLLTHEVLPRLTSRASSGVVRSRAVRTWGVPESSLAEKLDGVEGDIAPLSLAYLPGINGVDLRLTAWDLPAPRLMNDSRRGFSCCAPGSGIRSTGKTRTISPRCCSMRHAALACRSRRVNPVREGCWEGESTRIAGSSEVYLGGIVAYSNAGEGGGVERLGTAHRRAWCGERTGGTRDGSRCHTGYSALIAAMSITGIAGPGVEPRRNRSDWFFVAIRVRR